MSDANPRKTLMKVIALTLLCASTTLFSSAAFSQSAPDDCKGTVEIIRFSTLKDGATMANFEKAVAQHMAWYRSHGYTKNTQTVASVLTNEGISKTEVVTIHKDAPGVPKEKQDAEWKAFVDAYRAASDITAEKTICLPN
jgi:hypothetical protein